MFNYIAYLPCVQKEFRFRELTVRHYKNILKFAQNSDTLGLNMYFNEILKELCVSGDVSTLNRVDKFIALLHIRNVCIGPVVKYEFVCDETKKSYNAAVDIVNIINSFDEYKTPRHQTVDIHTPTSQIQVEISLPSQLYYNTVTDLIVDSLLSVTIDIDGKRERYVTYDYTIEQKHHVVDYFDNNHQTSIIDELKKYSDFYNNITLISQKSPYATVKKHSVLKVNTLDNSLMTFLQSIYSENLMNFFKHVYGMITKVGIDMMYADNLTPAEVNLYGLMYSEEKRKQAEAARNKQQSSGQMIGSPV